MNVNEILDRLGKVTVNTWFDLGLFIDHFKENRKVPSAEFPGFFEDFREAIIRNGIAFITFQFGIDGVTIETAKYAEAFRSCLPDVPIHFIAGEFRPEGNHLIDPSYKKHTVKGVGGFDKWALYEDFFLIKLERGSPEYNALIHKFWDQVLLFVEKLGRIIEENKINLLYLLNICSNPGNVSLSLAVVLLSEYLGIPVINNSHDFYWEEGNREVDIVNKGLRRGPRDFFFRNSDVGEFFSLIEILFPWESRSWLQVNINRSQCRHLIELNGHNPANVMEINTAVDMKAFQTVSRQRMMKVYLEIADALGRYSGKPRIYSPGRSAEMLADPETVGPILIGNREQTDFDFVRNNIIFLQPTRIMVRKRIHISFELIEKLFEESEFSLRFSQNPLLRLTLLVTGPVAAGHHEYLLSLIDGFSKLLGSLPEEFRGRIYLAFLFSEFDRERFIDKYRKPLTIPEIYSIASLILLPSETEGRGLPIIEAAASGVPIFCHRYHPRRVYNAVIGMHLDEKDRLRVLDFEGKNIGKKITGKVSDWIFFPQKFFEDVKHNLSAVEKRYSMSSLRKRIDEFIHILYNQLKPNIFSMQRTADALEDYRKSFIRDNKILDSILNTENRHYLPGYGRLSFMLLLKSLIDPSYFRVEEQRVRGMAMQFARGLVGNAKANNQLPKENVARFYNAVDNIFLYRDGEISIRHDHSMAYRHRNKNHYPYQDFTIQELFGLINLLFNKIVIPEPSPVFEAVPHHFTDRNLALFQLTDSSNLAIDDRDRLLDKLQNRIPIALFLGENVKYELDYFALQHVRDQMELALDEELTKEKLLERRDQISPVYIFCPERPLGRRVTAASLENYIEERGEKEFKLLFKYGLCRIVKTSQWCAGIHFPQMGLDALETLARVKQSNGCLVAIDSQAPLMTDIVDLDRFHIGRVDDELSSRIMGIPEGSGYVQFVPAGVRPTLAFPTPVQTARDFSAALKSDEFLKLQEEIGREKLFEIIKEDAESKGSPIHELLENLSNEKKSGEAAPVSYSYVSGIYQDGMPWNGALAKACINSSERKWNFAAFTAGAGRKQVTAFIDEFQQASGKQVQIAWNGGYILNAELVGKLGLSETYIGSPLGLVISNGKILCPPLFNKPAFLVYEDGRLDIERVSSREGFTLSGGNAEVEFIACNPADPPIDEPCFYDLMYSEDTVPGKGRVIVRLAGNTIKEVIHSGKYQNIPVIPVGLTLSLPESLFPKSWGREGLNLQIRMSLGEGVLSAVEAGPMLVENGGCSIDMELEGWKTVNSIRTQAARLDFLDMRGPKIAIGLDKTGDLSVLTINGRIRESVGATHRDMAEILIKQGIVKAMGFDPGGSSTLVARGRVLNISPYNSDYEREVISLPPEPRPVGNAVLGWQD